MGPIKNNSVIAKVKLHNSDEKLKDLYLIIQSTRYGIYMLCEATKSTVFMRKPSVITKSHKRKGKEDYIDHQVLTNCGKYNILRSWDLYDIENIKKNEAKGTSFEFTIDAFNMYAPLKYVIECEDPGECESFTTTLEILKQQIGTFDGIQMRYDNSYLLKNVDGKSSGGKPKPAHKGQDRLHVGEGVPQSIVDGIRLKNLEESFEYQEKKPVFEYISVVNDLKMDSSGDNNLLDLSQLGSSSATGLFDNRDGYSDIFHLYQ